MCGALSAAMRRVLVAVGAAAIVIGTCHAEEPARLTADDRAERIEEQVERHFRPLVERGWAEAVVVGVIDERGQRVFGFGRRSADDPRTPDGESVFEIGSITKVFTGILLADMAERGELSIDDPVNRFLPDDVPPLKCGGREMRLVDLATHTSGLPRLPGNISPADMTQPYADYTTDKLFDFLREQGQPSVIKSLGESVTGLFGMAPKQSWAYSNLGVGLLGNLLERKAGRPYEELLLERICQPLGMSSTRVTPDDVMLARLVSGHDAEGRAAPNWKFGCLAPCGALQSSVNDLLKFLAANMGLVETPLKEALERAQQVQFTVKPELKMGLNWLLLKDDWVFHNGMTAGYSSMVCFSKPERLGVVVLAGTTVGGEGGLLDRAGHSLVKNLSSKDGGEPPTIRAATTVERAILQKYAGQYTLVPLIATITVTCEDDRLYAQLTGQQRFRIYPESEREFFYKITEAQVTFECSEAGEVERLVLHQNGKDMKAARQVAK